MPYFVFLEFTAPRVREFLHSLRNSLSGKSETKPIHITVRGPYDAPPDVRQMEEFSEEIRGYGIVIGGAGTFNIPGGYVVYLKVQSPAFGKIWWKPDYKIEEYGINPHISLFETKNQSEARLVEQFLRNERIEIYTFGTALTVNMSKQGNLFEMNIDSELQKARSRFMERWKVKPGIIERASSLRRSFEPSR